MVKKSNLRWGCNGVGDDFYSYGFDGRSVFFAGRERVVSPHKLEKGDVVGCALDLNIPEIRYLEDIFNNRLSIAGQSVDDSGSL